MKRWAIVAACVIAAGLFVTFVGFPYRYSHETYRAVGDPPAIGQLQVQVRLDAEALRYLLGAPVRTGGPYRLSIRASGNECRDRRLVLHSVMLENDDGTRLPLLHGEYGSEFAARAIWRTSIYPGQPLVLPFEKGTELNILLDMTLVTTSGEVRRTVEQRFSAAKFDGYRLFPLVALWWA